MNRVFPVFKIFLIFLWLVVSTRNPRINFDCGQKLTSRLNSLESKGKQLKHPLVVRNDTYFHKTNNCILSRIFSNCGWPSVHLVKSILSTKMSCILCVTSYLLLGEWTDLHRTLGAYTTWPGLLHGVVVHYRSEPRNRK